MDFYSATLGLAIVAAVAALGLVLVGWLASRGVALRSTPVVAVIALVLVLVSGLSHRITGHPSGSSSALGPAAFLREHPALLVTAGLAIAALVLLRIAARATREAKSGGRGD